jgi:hypothetical protein
MTIEELFEEYANIIYNLRVDPKYRYSSTGRTLEQIIQEVEALVRKETIVDIMAMQFRQRHDLQMYAQSKGIQL